MHGIRCSARMPQHGCPDIVVVTPQVAKGLAYPVNGVIMGGLDWGWLSLSTWLSNAACCAVIAYFKPTQTIATIWYGLCTFMSMQCLTGLARILSRTGAWTALRNQASPTSAKSQA